MASSDAEIFVAKHIFAKPGPNMKGMMTLTYDLVLLHKYLGPKPKIRQQVWTLYGS